MRGERLKADRPVRPHLTLWQPWASLIFEPHGSPAKVHETRSWVPPSALLGEWLMIHAAQRPMRPIEWSPGLRAAVRETFGMDRPPLPLGAVIGRVRVVSYAPTEKRAAKVSPRDLACGDWRRGRWAIELADATRLAEMIPRRGLRRIWYARAPV